jgi:PPOX class probable F420-dependent enzyme
MSKVMDLQYKLFDRARHPRALEAAREAGTAPDFSTLRGARQALVVTFKRSGTPVATPVNFGLDEQGRLYFRSEPHVAKIRRIRRDARVRVGPCNLRGKPLGPMAEGRARVLPAEEEERAYAALAANWSAAMTVLEKGADRMPLEMVYVEVEPVP